MKRYLMWLCLFFSIGILTVCPLSERSVVYLSAAFCIGFILLCLFKKMFVFSAVLCAAFAVGVVVMMVNADCSDVFKPFNGSRRIICGTVRDSYPSGEYMISIIETDSVEYRRVKDRLKLYVKDGERYDFGDKLYVVASLQTPEKPKRKSDVDYRAYNYSRGIYANCFADNTKVKLIEKGKDNFSIEKFGVEARRRIKQEINKLLPETEAGILTALMLGDKSGVSDEFKDIGSKVGIYHTMATSGLHVSILLTFFGLIISRIVHHRRVSALLNIAVLALLYVVIGYSPSISRAVIMSALMCISLITYSKADSLTSLAVSAAVILTFSPYALFDVGFLLSFASTLGILIIYKKVSGAVKIKSLSVLLMSFSALLGTGALTAFYFGRITLLGTLSNMLIVPLAELILPIGYLSAVSAILWFPLGDFLSYAVYPLLKLYVYIAELFAKLPFASAEVQKPAAFTAFIITIGIFVLFAFIPVKGEFNDGRTTEKKSGKQRIKEYICFLRR